MRWFKTIRWILLSIGLFCVVQSWAMPVANLNVATVPVANRTAPAFAQALNQAFKQVLIKMTGNAQVVNIPAIQAVLKNPNSYVVSYSYIADQQEGYDNSPAAPLFLQVTFNLNSLQQLLQKNGQSVWNNQRPLTLVWVVVPEETQTVVLSNDGDKNLLRAMHQASEARGIPVIFPTMDLQDQNNAGKNLNFPTDVQLQASAKRYGVQASLAGVLSSNNNLIQGNWKLMLNGKTQAWQNSGDSVATVLAGGMQKAADLLASQQVATATAAPVTLQISGVHNLDDYVHVMAILRGLTNVSQVTPLDMAQDILLLRLDTMGGVSALSQALSKNTDFVALTNAAQTSVGTSVDLYYQWKPAVPAAPTPAVNTTPAKNG